MKVPRVIAEAETSFGTVVVEMNEEYWYVVKVNGVVKHDKCWTEDVMRVLCHYLHGAKK